MKFIGQIRPALLGRILWKRRSTVITVETAILGLALLWIVAQRPIYRSTVGIQIDSEKSDGEKTVATELAARSLALLVIQDLHLETTREFATAGSADSDPMRRFIDTYLDHLHVVPGGAPHYVKISFDSEDPQLAARVANAHARHFIEQNISNKWADTQQASGFLNQQLAGLKANLEKSEEKLQDYARENQIIVTEDGLSTATVRLSQLEEEYAKVQAERIEKESYERLAHSESADSIPQMRTAVTTALHTTLVELKRQDSVLALTETPEHPDRKHLLSEISQTEKALESERESIIRQIHADYTAAVEREKSLGAALDEQRKRANDIDRKMVEYNILKREVDSNKGVYDSLHNRLLDAGIAAGLKASNIRVVEPAEVPISPVKTHRAAIVLAALVGGLLVGVAAALLQEFH